MNEFQKKYQGDAISGGILGTGLDTNFVQQKLNQDQDPWKHRSEGMRCQTCIWYVPKIPTNPTKPQDYRGLGRCRRHAPTMNGYPVVWCDDWCGDHRIDENKV
jgi:hypothetical protein